MSGLILHLAISQSPVFLINSRLDLFTAASLRWRPFSRSYRSILPNSLAMNLSSTLGFSPRLPVSVCGTGGMDISLEVFLGSLIRVIIHSSEDLWYYHLRQAPRIYLRCLYLRALTYISVSTQTFHYSVTPSLSMSVQEYQPVVHRLRRSAIP